MENSQKWKLSAEAYQRDKARYERVRAEKRKRREENAAQAAADWRERRRLARLSTDEQAEHLLAKAVYWESQGLDVLAERDFRDAERAACGVNVYHERDMQRPAQRFPYSYRGTPFKRGYPHTLFG